MTAWTTWEDSLRLSYLLRDRFCLMGTLVEARQLRKEYEDNAGSVYHKLRMGFQFQLLQANHVWVREYEHIAKNVDLTPVGFGTLKWGDGSDCLYTQAEKDFISETFGKDYVSDWDLDRLVGETMMDSTVKWIRDISTSCYLSASKYSWSGKCYGVDEWGVWNE